MPHRERAVHPPRPEGPAGDLSSALLAEGVSDKRVLAAFRAVRRKDFVPTEWAGAADDDRPIPIPHGQVTTQPSLIAHMVEALRLTGVERVLEVGTGFGFQTAVLAALAPEVYSIERFPDLAERARANLAAAGIHGIGIMVGDGTLGLPEHAPFDAIVVSAASPEVPLPLVEQLTEGGRIVHPVGSGGNEVVVAFEKRGGGLVRRRVVTLAHFVRLVGAHAFPDEPLPRQPFTPT